jgi:hypothetical protein
VKGKRPKGKDIPIPCPICGKRICDCKGSPEGEFEIELKCSGACGFVSLGADYFRKILTKETIKP